MYYDVANAPITKHFLLSESITSSHIAKFLLRFSDLQHLQLRYLFASTGISCQLISSDKLEASSRDLGCRWCKQFTLIDVHWVISLFEDIV